MSDLARDLVAHPRFARAAGMRLLRPDGGFPIRIVDIDPRIATHEGSGGDFATGWWPSDVPDLADDATVGVLWDTLTRTDGGSTWSLTEGWGRCTISRDTGSGPGCVTSWSILGGRGDAIATALLAVWNAAENTAPTKDTP